MKRVILLALASVLALAPSVEAHQFWHLYECHVDCSYEYNDGPVLNPDPDSELKMRYCLVFDETTVNSPSETKIIINIWLHCVCGTRRFCSGDPPPQWSQDDCCEGGDPLESHVMPAETDHDKPVELLDRFDDKSEFAVMWPCTVASFNAGDHTSYDGHAANSWGAWYAANKDLSAGNQIEGEGESYIPDGWFLVEGVGWDLIDAGKINDSLPDCSF